jgi:F-type H+-transporting ATPase subunit epsilon
MDPLKIDLEIVTPGRLVASETVDEVVLPGTEGYLGVLPGHAPLLTGLAAGEISYRSSGHVRYLAVSGGFAEVLRHRVSVLAETCERAEEIDVARANEARERARADIGRADAADADLRRAAARLRKAEVRIAVAKRASAG